MTRNLELFAELPYSIRRYIVLLIRVYHRLGYTLMRPFSLDLRQVAPLSDFSEPWADWYNPRTEIRTQQWLGFDHC